MIYGLYLSAQGAQAQSTRLDVIANNLANASTSAFKRDLALFQAHSPYDVENGLADELPHGLHHATGGLSLAGVATDFSDGPPVATGGTLDVALSGPGFLRVSDGKQEFLTRHGSLAVNAQGELVTQDGGHHVLSAIGARIAIPPGADNVQIAADGSIEATGPELGRVPLARLGLVRPESPASLEKVGNSLYRWQGGLAASGGEVQVMQGFLEGSGTSPVREMLQLIEASRAFETNINMVRQQDEALGRLLQTAGRR